MTVIIEISLRSRYKDKANLNAHNIGHIGVFIQCPSTNQHARIHCRDYLITLYSEKIITYELFHNDTSDMNFRIKKQQ
ncbi:hypothetical protein H8356DRAFT_1699018 [Neocallimastix lanati (nom. inval.)]|nr:hypothetical protein H8356DRAFT_1699018 [Neocallimastix sp. JGI-2020a]